MERELILTVDGSLPPAQFLRKTMSTTAGNDAADDSMDEIKADTEQGPQGSSPPPLLGSYIEAGTEDKGKPAQEKDLQRTSEMPGDRACFA